MKKKPNYHFHTCNSGDKKHTWRHEGARETCNLSNHTHCGFSRANDLATCLKQNKLTYLPAKRFDYKVDANGFAILYRGQVIGKDRLTLKQQKVKRHPMTVKKDTRQYEFSAQKIVAQLGDGNGSKKLWAKIRKIDKATKGENGILAK